MYPLMRLFKIYSIGLIALAIICQFMHAFGKPKFIFAPTELTIFVIYLEIPRVKFSAIYKSRR